METCLMRVVKMQKSTQKAYSVLISNLKGEGGGQVLHSGWEFRRQANTQRK